jgi:hypothetical protein
VNAGQGAAFWLAVVRVAMERHRDGVAVERLFQLAAPQEGIDLRRLTFHGCLDRCVVQQGDPLRRPELRQRLVDRQAVELFELILSSGLHHNEW